ncbi:MAG: hypothetical protein NC120_10655, partial [Ruminococcus sp.]|nr:hypothetical protein [Ruminococcus sp.]
MSKKISEFSGIIKTIVDNNGKDTLKDRKRTDNFLSDMAPGDKLAKEKKLLNDAYSCNAVSLLLIDDPSEGRRKKAVASAKAKLLDSYVTEEGANIILKDLCDALGWDTEKLLVPSPAAKSSAAKQPVRIIDAPMAVNEAPLRTELAEQPQVTADTKPKKKRSCLGTLVKAAVAAAVILGLYNYGKKDESEIVTVDEPSVSEAADTSVPETTTSAEAVLAAVTTALTAETEPVTEEIIEEIEAEITEPIFVSETTAALLVEETTVPETTTEPETTTTADPRAGKFTVVDIAKVAYSTNNINYDNIMTYDSNDNALYYVLRPNELHKYSFTDMSDTVVINIEDILSKIEIDSSKENVLTNKSEADKGISEICAVELHRYNGNLFVFFYTEVDSKYYRYVYDINDDKFIGGSSDLITTLYFINEDEFFKPSCIEGYSV